VDAGAGSPGSVAAVGDDGVSVRCGDGGAVRLSTALPEGAKRGPIGDWVAAAGILVGAQFE
jgi:methionyl-tRNA formyltransferase